MSNSELPRTDWLDLAVMSRNDSDDYDEHWGSILDEENFERLDKEVMVSGTYDERPDVAPYDGAKFHAKDVNATFAWDDSTGEWIVLNSGTTDSPVPGTTNLEAVEADSVNAAHYIRPDDDIQRVFSEAGVGDAIHFDPGVHSIETPLTVDTAGLRITASDEATLLPTENVGYVIRLNAPNQILDGMHIDCRDRAREGIRQSKEGQIRNCTVENVVETPSDLGTTSGIVSYADGPSRIENCTVNRVRSPETHIGRGIRVTGTGPYWILNSRVSDVEPAADADGIVTEGTGGDTIVRGCVIEDIAEGGVKINNESSTCIFADNILRNSSKSDTFAAIRVQESDALIRGNEIYWEDPSRGVHIVGSNVRVIGNRIDVSSDTHAQNSDGVRINGVHSGIRIVDNDMIGVNRDGVYHERTGGLSGIKVRGNDIQRPARHGVNLNTPDSGQHENISVSDNEIDAPGGYGIRIDTADYVTTVGNVLRDAGLTELRVENTSNHERAANTGDFSDGT